MIHPQQKSSKGIPKVLLVGGSDSSGAAGIQADAKFLNSLGVEGLYAITALTTQDHENFIDLGEVEKNTFENQLISGLKQTSILKLGMLCSKEILEVLINEVESKDLQIVCDPVFKSSTKKSLLDPGALDLFIKKLLPKVSVLTPNITEAEVLTGMSIKSNSDIEEALKKLSSLGPKLVYLKTGHFEEQIGAIHDAFIIDGKIFWVGALKYPFSSPRGTGCALAASMAGALSLGLDLKDAVILARICLQKAIRKSRLDGKHRILNTSGSFLENLLAEDMVWIKRYVLNFKSLDHQSRQTLLYPIVDNKEHLQKCILANAPIIQLRVKNLEGERLEKEIKDCIEMARGKTRLFINDYWQLAIKYKAYGVHLGQEDLDEADLTLIEKSGLRLGVSTHSYFEAAKIRMLNPSYVALGPIFHTALKAMDFVPQGVKSLRTWKLLFDCPIVAIGGINLERVNQVQEAGPDIISIVRDITLNSDPTQRALDIMDEMQRGLHGRI